MRYVKCDKCNKDISGQPKIVMSYISETRGKHRNAEKKEMVRLCLECGKQAFLSAFPYGKFEWDQETLDEKTFDSDKQKGEIRYNRMKVERKKVVIPSENGKNDAVWLTKDVKMYQSNQALLLQKINNVAQKYKLLVPTFNPLDINDIEMGFKISLKMADILEKLGCIIQKYAINTDRSYVTFEKSIPDSKGNLIKTIDEPSKDLTYILNQLKTIDTHYIKKMANDLMDVEYKQILIESLKELYQFHNNILNQNKILIEDSNNTIIDISLAAK